MKTSELIKSVVFGRIIKYDQIMTIQLHNKHKYYCVEYYSEIEGYQTTRYVEIVNNRNAYAYKRNDFIKRMNFVITLF